MYHITTAHIERRIAIKGHQGRCSLHLKELYADNKSILQPASPELQGGPHSQTRKCYPFGVHKCVLRSVTSTKHKLMSLNKIFD